MEKGIWLYLILVNLMAFILFGADKLKAKIGRWRIAESTLIGISFIGGAFGAILGMYVWRHKIRKWKFRILVPLCLIGWVIFLIGFWR